MDWAPLSASQLETWKLCPRRWFFKHIQRRPSPPNRFAEFGLVFHPMAEAWLKHGTFPDPRKYAPGSAAHRAAASLLAGLAHLPRPRHPGLVQEYRFEFDVHGIAFQGAVDYAAPSASGFARCADVPLVGDHKTTGAFEWTEGPEDDDVTAAIRDAFGVPNKGPDPRPNTPDKLRANTQAMLYALWAMTECGAEWTALNWVHFRRRDEPGAEPVREDDGTVPYVSRDEAEGFAESAIIPEAQALIKLRRKHDVLRPENVTPNPAACFAYGGPCPFMNACGLWTNKTEVQAMSLASIVGKKNQAKTGAPAPKAAAGKAPPWQGKGVNRQGAQDETDEVEEKAPAPRQAAPKTPSKPKAASRPRPEPEPEETGVDVGEMVQAVRDALAELCQSEDQDVRDVVLGLCARTAAALSQ